jgi:hypothetical protein
MIGDENVIALSLQSNREGESAMKQRQPILHLFGGRIAKEKKRHEALAAGREPGPESEDLLNTIRQLDNVDQIDECLSSPGLQAPR